MGLALGVTVSVPLRVWVGTSEGDWVLVSVRVRVPDALIVTVGTATVGVALSTGVPEGVALRVWLGLIVADKRAVCAGETVLLGVAEGNPKGGKGSGVGR